MRTLLVATLLLGCFAAQAAPLKLDERQLGTVAAGSMGLFGPVNVAIGISNPTDVDVTPSTGIVAGADVNVANQVGTGVAAGTTTAVGVLGSNIAASGLTGVGVNLGTP